MKRVVLALVVCLGVASTPAGAAEPAPAAEGPVWRINHSENILAVTSGGKAVLGYQLRPGPDTDVPVASACYFHPLTTPSGTVVTDVAPPDHRHHRGVFLAWVETHGKVAADFWGWGEHAPIKGRQVVNRRVNTVFPKEGTLRDPVVRFTLQNDWVADEQPVLHEELRVAVRQDPAAKANVLDLTYTLTPPAELTLARWAFSGFCVRTLGPGAAPQLVAHGPDGEVKLPNPSHVKPESDWPAAPWYAYALKLKDGKEAGVAVVDHPKNPPSLWHNHRDVRMLNPCIVAPDKVVLKANQPLVLRYRVVAHDGPTQVKEMDRLAAEWRQE